MSSTEMASLDQALKQLEELTDSLVKSSADPTGCDANDLKSGIEQRAVLIRNLSEQLRESPAVAYTEYNRLITLLAQGKQIEANLQKLRASIVAALNRASQERRYAERLADQLVG